MFDDVLGMATLCSEHFRDGVPDAFGASLATEVLDPILKEIDSLRIFNTEFQRQVLSIDTSLADARGIQGHDHGWDR
ncbi:hypothetical protein O0882_23465 [Janthinobacterium sp. SUN073]|uniref:hypothetical protein n=1 Tax=Janthinobacterium sp. SUN073 TaxID=3004102 RepID=UPI0025B1C499|nr:hypothetical protein [Janthinobacterium sp. SUN073]MDN2699279.1 hypothetical protein [Janthinobacterium sp. SUN073]